MTFTARRWKALAAVLAGGALSGALVATAPAAMASTSTSRTPTAPANLHVVSNVSNVGIELAWSPSADQGGTVDYFLYADNNTTPSIVGSNTSFDVPISVVQGFIPGSTHTFKVQAQDVATGNSSFSSPLTVTFAPGDNAPPTAPANLHVVSNDSGGIVLAWDPSTDDTSIAAYFVDGRPCSPREVDGLGTASPATTAGVPSISGDPVCGLTPGDTYTFSVRARDSVGFDSPQSNPVTVTFKG